MWLLYLSIYKYLSQYVLNHGSPFSSYLVTVVWQRWPCYMKDAEMGCEVSKACIYQQPVITILWQSTAIYQNIDP